MGGGEYCVPASTDVFAPCGFSVVVADPCLPNAEALAGERGNFRGRADARGDLMS